MTADSRGTRSARGGDDIAVALEPKRRLQLLHDCRDLVLGHLSRFIAEALERLSDELAIAAMKEAGRESQQALLEALSLVRVHRNDIEFRFRELFAELFERRLAGRGAGQAGESQAAADGEELTLVDDAAIDHRIALERLVRRARVRLDPDQVLGMRARFAALLDREWFTEDDYPASPEIVFEALQRSLDELSPPAEVRSALLQAFEPHVASSLNMVYSSVNEQLRSQSVLPKIRPPLATTPGRQERAPAAAARVSSPGAMRDRRLDGGAAGHRAGDATGFAATTGGVPGTPARSGFGAALPASIATGAGDDPASADGSNSFEELMRRVSAGQPSARQSAVRMLADPDIFGMADLPMPSVEAPLIEALHTMQSDVPVRAAGEVPALSTQLLDQARSKGSSLDQLTVEIVSLVFDYIYADRQLPDAVKQQLLRLQVVAVKAALLDRSFFARRQHPMRRLIDRITELAVDPDADLDGDSSLAAGITGIVDWILENFDDDLATFNEAMLRLDRLARSEAERRAARLIEITRNAERLEALGVAQEEASAEFALRIDAVTPVFVREFLYREWSRAMAMARVDGDCAGAPWDESLQVAEWLIWSVAPKAPEDIARLAQLLPRLIGALMKGLKAVGTDEGVRERFFNELLQWHTRAIQDAKLAAARTIPGSGSALRMSPDGTLRLEAENARDAAARSMSRAASVRPAAHAIVDALQRGDLVEVADDGGVMRALKVAWISPTRKLFVLTRFPGVGLSSSRQELIDLFTSGRARMADAQSTLDRAIDAVAQPDAEGQGARDEPGGRIRDAV